MKEDRCPACQRPITENDYPLVSVDRDGRRWHVACSRAVLAKVARDWESGRTLEGWNRNTSEGLGPVV